MISTARTAPSFDVIYKKNMQWGLYGSMLFEGIVLVHRVMIFSTLSLQAYGIVVSMLSLIHLGAHIADWGATNSVPPLLPYFTRSKQHFKSMMLYHTLALHLPIVLLTTAIMAMWLQAHPALIDMPGALAIFAFLVCIESARNFVRQFLYTVQRTQLVVTIELSLLFGRIVVLWGAYLVLQQPLTPFFILASHVVEMLLCMLLFAGVLRGVYRGLPDYAAQFSGLCSYPSRHSAEGLVPQDERIQHPAHPEERATSVASVSKGNFQYFARIKFFNYILRLSRNLFTSNFLTPLFALHFGLATAGIFYFASKLASALLSVVKITIGYAGNGLLAAAKKTSDSQLRVVFARLSRKLFLISVPLVAVFIVLAPLVSHFWYAQQLSYQIFMLCTLFLLLSIAECSFILYECFYIIQHAAQQLFVMKLVELAIFYGFMYFFKTTSPYVLLMGVVMVRLLTLAAVVYHAYCYWHVAPAIKKSREIQ